MYLLSPKVKRLGTKGSENSEKFFENTIKNHNRNKLWRSSDFSPKYQKESVVKHTP
jgi:hypothetical protein